MHFRIFLHRVLKDTPLPPKEEISGQKSISPATGLANQKTDEIDMFNKSVASSKALLPKCYSLLQCGDYPNTGLPHNTEIISLQARSVHAALLYTNPLVYQSDLFNISHVAYYSQIFSGFSFF